MSVQIKNYREKFDLLAAKYGIQCAHCGAEEHLTIDHIIPRCSLGSDDIENLQLLCMNCNRNKGKKRDPLLKGKLSIEGETEAFIALADDIGYDAAFDEWYGIDRD